MIHSGETTALQLSIIPDYQCDRLVQLLDKLETLFEDKTGSSVLVPTHDLPFHMRDEYPSVPGTRVEGYTTKLDVFFWQFGRPWMGLHL